MSGAAQATTPLPPDLQKFANCPTDNPDVALCVYITTTKVRFKLGKFDLSSTKPVTLELGVKFDPDTDASSSVGPTNGHKILTASPIQLPGGLLGIPGAEFFPLDAYATPELIGVPDLDTSALLQREGTALAMNLKAKVSNPFTDVLSALGPGCYVGSNSDPIELRLTSGTTDPPPPNTPISGDRGVVSNDGMRLGGLLLKDTKTVDNSFAAPGAHGCGNVGPFWSPLNAVVNAQGNLPAAAGKNTGVMDADVYTMDADVVREAQGLP